MCVANGWEERRLHMGESLRLLFSFLFFPLPHLTLAVQQSTSTNAFSLAHHPRGELFLERTRWRVLGPYIISRSWKRSDRLPPPSLIG